jgi:DNA mismatch endonuclease (patch repair protein)
MDFLTPEKRSKLMANVRSKDTSTERAVRRIVHALGFRFRLHKKDLPGKPDLVFASKKKVIFVHGCFWHRHSGCKYASTPKTKIGFWTEKFERNTLRDRMVKKKLKKLGWTSLVIWQCELKKINALKSKIKKFLNED